MVWKADVVVVVVVDFSMVDVFGVVVVVLGGFKYSLCASVQSSNFISSKARTTIS